MVSTVKSFFTSSLPLSLIVNSESASKTMELTVTFSPSGITGLLVVLEIFTCAELEFGIEPSDQFKILFQLVSFVPSHTFTVSEVLV